MFDHRLTLYWLALGGNLESHRVRFSLLLDVSAGRWMGANLIPFLID